MKIVITGGGSGGHIFPLVAVTKKIRERLGTEADVLYIGPSGKLEIETMQKYQIPVKNILAGKMRRYFSGLNFLDALKLPVALVQSLWHLLWFLPDVVFAKGGYASVPVVIAAWVYNIPVLIHESDAIPGVANRISGKFAKRVGISYPSARRFFDDKKVMLTGNPIREEINKGIPSNGRTRFGFTESKPVLLVMGGSQGSTIINQSILTLIPNIIDRIQVIHQTGEKDYEEMVHEVAKYGIKSGHHRYVAVPFMDIETLKDAYAVADVIISRAGANSIANIAACGKPSILVPLATAANDHQRMNAYEISKIGGAVVLEESNLGAHLLAEKIETILTNETLNASLSQKIRAFYHPEAADKLADGIISLAKK